ncbi:MAG: class I SAM-dependent methyltransferase [Flavobacteriales bacterium]|nr:class I SAM-dependent methyltransferase [Flavobacteriales bacterium]
MRWKIAQRLELRWWKRYLRNRNLEESLSWKKAYWQDFVAQLNLPKIEGRTLDAGCGPAGVFMILNEADVTAIDPLLEKYENDLNLPSEEYKERITFKPLGIEDYFMIEHFDFIFCLNAINHVKDMSKALHNLGESLKPGGRMIVSIDCHNFKLFKGLFKILPFDILHPHQFDLDEYQSQLMNEGIKVERSILIKNGFIFNYYALVGRRI